MVIAFRAIVDINSIIKHVLLPHKPPRTIIAPFGMEAYAWLVHLGLISIAITFANL
jgi:hypothetical protein